MLRVRQGLFETNSSSTHSCIITTKDLDTRWGKGELLYSRNSKEKIQSWIDNLSFADGVEHLNDEFYSVKDMLYKGIRVDELSGTDRDEFDEDREDILLTFEEWAGDELEIDTTSKVIDGKEIVVTCRFGFDG